MSPNELALLADRLVNTDPENWRRIRLAISREEFEALRERANEHSQEFVEAVRGLPLIVEDDPDRPIYRIWSKTNQIPEVPK